MPIPAHLESLVDLVVEAMVREIINRTNEDATQPAKTNAASETSSNEDIASDSPAQAA
jgi:hypothetical protein